MKPINICDTHNDFLTELKESQILPYLKTCGAAGVKSICSSFWSSKMPEADIRGNLSARAKLLQKWNSQQITPQALLHCEDLWWVKTEDDLNFLISLKPFSASLTWNYENCLAGGAKSNGQLSPWGKHVAEKLLQRGVLVDVAHLNRKSFEQTCQIAKQNIFCSHTGFCGIRNHPRNLSLKQIETIVNSGGFVGLFFFDKCITPNQQIQKTQTVKGDLVTDIVQNIKFFSTRFGWDNLGIGSDFFGVDNLPPNLQTYADFTNLQKALAESGISQENIQKLFHQNFEDFLQRKKGL